MHMQSYLMKRQREIDRVKYLLHTMIYAEDTQVYTECENSVTSMNNATTRLGLYINGVCEWMRYNTLKLNE